MRLPPESPEFDRLKEKIYRERGFNTHFYKDKCIRRRIGVRMRARGITEVADYTAFLDSEPQEFDQLIRALTINVSKFFRNPEVWQILEDRVVPDLFARPGVQNLWSAGCACGEEPYSLSILIHEWAERENQVDRLADFRIVGTDIDEDCLRAAEEAIYPKLAFAETPPERFERWFTTGVGAAHARLKHPARGSVEFTKKDLISDPPLGNQSLILCRNVIIYFSRDVQNALFERFYHALEPGGYLVLGKVETLLGPARKMFEIVSTRERIFRKKY